MNTTATLDESKPAASSLLDTPTVDLDHSDAGLSPSPAKSVPVLHVINGEHYSGAERVQDLLALRLDEFGYDVAFACLKQGKFGDARRSTVPITYLHMAGKFDLRAAWRLARLVKSVGHQIIHAHSPRSAMIGRLASALTGVPLVYHVHSPTSRDSTRGLANRVNALVERHSVRRAAKLIAVSHSLGRHMQESGFGEDKLTVVPNGVPILGDLTDRPTPTGDWVLGTVALFRPRKGTEVLIDAVAALREAGTPVRLRCIGGFETPDYEADLKTRVAEHSLQDHVDWVGFTQDVPGELAKLDLFVLPSLFGEGLPMVVLEAMAAGVPVVATDVEGVPEAVRDGEDGVIAAPSDATALAAAIRRVVNGKLDWQQLRHSAHQRHGEHFSDRSMAAGVAAAYDGVLSRC